MRKVSEFFLMQGANSLQLPVGSKMLGVNNMRALPMLSIEHDVVYTQCKQHIIHMVPVGREIPEQAVRYIGATDSNGQVCHVYAEKA